MCEWTDIESLDVDMGAWAGWAGRAGEGGVVRSRRVWTGFVVSWEGGVGEVGSGEGDEVRGDKGIVCMDGGG